ncbi:hypothetical protein B0H16DRAFT_74158 [Mycena metata]|uniref:TEA domain-containing protein n=1 Tax=Mycena metata TaxID=1033252 RepID=A0AAD7JYS5_9AGAR|nr:hypothetical protein B0H16DRAFT_74158 [Mycena metata]
MPLPLPTIMDESSPQSTSKSLTPQRKHRKLLKDGSGTAVWPESIESVFVQGLREYNDSPWATYTRGRSRWRNQFLVDYLNNLGIVRSKKQVASHIQVLRNMWKGEPEYHLVAGGEELFPQDPVKLEEHTTLIPLEEDLRDDASSLSNSPPEFLSDFPPSPGETSPSFPGLSYSPSSPLSSIPDLESPPHTLATLAGPYPFPQNQKAAYPAYPATYHTPAPAPPVRYPNRTTSLTLLADGMTAFSVNLDKLAPPAALPARTPPLALRLRLVIPPVDDTRAPPNLHGFFGNIRLASLWTSQAKVFTRVYDSAGNCFCNETEPLHASTVELGTVVAALPESALSRARWCDATVQTTITQQIVVDGSTLLFVAYELDRRLSPSALPSVELVAFQKYMGNGDSQPPTSSPAYSYAPPANHNAAYAYAPPSQSPSPPTTYSPNGYYAPTTSALYTQSSPVQTYGHTHAAPPTSTYTPSLSSALTPVAPLRP